MNKMRTGWTGAAVLTAVALSFSPWASARPARPINRAISHVTSTVRSQVRGVVTRALHSNDRALKNARKPYVGAQIALKGAIRHTLTRLSKAPTLRQQSHLANKVVNLRQKLGTVRSARALVVNHQHVVNAGRLAKAGQRASAIRAYGHGIVNKLRGRR